jgi:anti-anti-sigma factor
MINFEIVKRRAASDTSISVLDIKGELTINTIGEFESVLKTYMQENKLKIILDMEATTQLSSAGIAVLFDAVREVRKKKGNVKFVGMSPQIRELVDLLELPELFHRYPTEVEAVEAFQEKALKEA